MPFTQEKGTNIDMTNRCPGCEKHCYLSYSTTREEDYKHVEIVYTFRPLVSGVPVNKYTEYLRLLPDCRKITGWTLINDIEETKLEKKKQEMPKLLREIVRKCPHYKSR